MDWNVSAVNHGSEIETDVLVESGRVVRDEIS